MDWAYWIALALGVAVAASVGLVVAGVVGPRGGSEVIRLAGSVGAGTGIGGVIWLLTYRALRPVVGESQSNSA